MRRRGEQEREVGELLALPKRRAAPSRAARAGRASVRMRGIGRGPVERRGPRLRQLGEVVLEPRQRAGVARREPLRLLDVGRHVVAEVVARAVGIEVERRPGRVDDDASLRPAACPARSPRGASTARRHRSTRGTRVRTPRCCRRRRRTAGARGSASRARPAPGRTRRRGRCGRRRSRSRRTRHDPAVTLLSRFASGRL